MKVDYFYFHYPINRFTLNNRFERWVVQVSLFIVIYNFRNCLWRQKIRRKTNLCKKGGCCNLCDTEGNEIQGEYKLHKQIQAGEEMFLAYLTLL